MARVTKDERIKRALKFLTASQEPPIAGLLMRRGFSNADRQEGWDLLDLAVGRHLELAPGEGSPAANYNFIIDKLDDWENIWFDVADAALSRKAPKVHAKLFHKLSKGSGIEVLVTVRTFLSRIADLKNDSDAEVQSAVSLLESRGLNETVLAEAEDLLTQLESAEPTEEPVDRTAFNEAREKAVADLWNWFLDWSKTARTVIKNGNYQVMLGLTTNHRTAGSQTVIDPLEDDAFAELEDTSDDIAQTM